LKVVEPAKLFADAAGADGGRPTLALAGAWGAGDLEKDPDPADLDPDPDADPWMEAK
jgi:hypothetical protein